VPFGKQKEKEGYVINLKQSRKCNTGGSYEQNKTGKN